MDDFDWDEEEERNQQREESEQELQQARSDFADDVKKFNDNLRKNQASSGTNTAKKTGDAANQASKTAKNAESAGKAAKNAETASKAAKTAETAGKAAKTAETASKAATVGKAAATAGKAAAGATTGPVGWVLLAIDAIKLIKAKREKSKNESFEEKFKKASPLLIILGLFVAPLSGVLILTGTVGYETVTYDSDMRLDDYIECIESKDGCEDMWGFVEEEVEGKDKPLIKFKEDEFDKAGEEYAEISFKYYKYGEGLEFKGYDKANDGSILTEDDLKELLSSSISSYLAVESKAFSKIQWYETEDGETYEKATLKEEFSVGSDEEDSFFTWLTQIFRKPKYKILIPNPDIYSVVKTTTKHISKEIIIGEGDNTGAESSKVVKESGLDPGDPQETETRPTEYDLEYYRKLVTGFLPEWIEPYSIYIATGDIELANSYSGILYNLLEDEDLGLEVVLYRENTHTIRTEQVELHQKQSTKTITKEHPNGETKTVTTNKTIINKYDILKTSYTPVVESGYKYNYILKKSGYTLGPAKEDASQAPSITVKPISIKNTNETKYSTVYVVVNGTQTSTTTVEQQPDSKSLVYKDDKRETVTYEDAIDDEKYNGTENAYINTRMAYIYKNYAEMFKEEYPDIFEDSDGEEIDDPFNLDLIGPALKEVDDYYTKESESSNSYINGSTIDADISDVPEGGFLWPTNLEVTPTSKKITSLYGKSKWYFDFSINHGGIDIVGGVENVTPIVAVQNGQVLAVQNNVMGFLDNSYGNYVLIGHGNYQVMYAHLSYTHKITVKVGDIVHMGQVIGFMGNTGNSYGTHLHFEVRKGSVTVDPMLFYNYTDNSGQKRTYSGTLTHERVLEIQSSGRINELDKDLLFQYNMRTKDPLPDNYNYESSKDPNAEKKADRYDTKKDESVKDDTIVDVTNKDNLDNNISKPDMNLSQTTTTNNNSANHNGGSYYTSSSGIKYYEWKQNNGLYSSKAYGGYGTFANYACPIVSASIFLQAYGVDTNPADLYELCGGPDNPKNAINKWLGSGKAKVMQVNDSGYTSTPPLDSKVYKEKIINQLKSGMPAVIHSTNGKHGHFLTIVDFNEKTNQVYISEVFDGYGWEGWHDVTSLFEGGLNINQFIYIPEGEDV